MNLLGLRLVTPEQVDKAHAYLFRARHVDNLIAVKLAQLDVIRKRATDASHVTTKEYVRSSIQDSMADIVSTIVDMEDTVLHEYHRLTQILHETMIVIDRIPDDNVRAVLELYYLQSVPFCKIAERMCYTERQIYRIHTRGLQYVALQHAIKHEEAIDKRPPGII